jgi:hypothetical protein
MSEAIAATGAMDRAPTGAASDIDPFSLPLSALRDVVPASRSGPASGGDRSFLRGGGKSASRLPVWHRGASND